MERTGLEPVTFGLQSKEDEWTELDYGIAYQGLMRFCAWVDPHRFNLLRPGI